MRSRSSKLPKYVYRQVVKGKTYYRFRKYGGGSVRLPDPGTSDFHSAYAKLLRQPAEDNRYSHGSVAWTVDLYIRSADYAQLAASTQRDYRRYLNRLDKAVGGRQLSALDTEFMFALRDRLRATPGAANHAIAVIRALYTFARKRKLVPIDPTEGVDKLRGGEGYRRWTDEDISKFRESAVPMMRLALELGLYTGQRLSDVIRLSWAHYDGAKIRIRQQKTKTLLVIPVHPDLGKLLDAMPRTGLMILATKTGRAFHPRVFSRDFKVAREAAGLTGLSFHGLRHTAASKLAELGAGAPEIQAITGHKSLKLVEHYIRQANQEVQAGRAIARLQRR